MSDSHKAHHAFHLAKHFFESDVGKAAAASATTGAIAAAPVVVPIAAVVGVAYGLYRLMKVMDK